MRKSKNLKTSDNDEGEDREGKGIQVKHGGDHKEEKVNTGTQQTNSKVTEINQDYDKPNLITFTHIYKTSG